MIYFAQPTDGGPVKIGYSDNVPSRIKQLEKHYGCTLAVLATMPGDFEEERAIHARFTHLRLDGKGRRGVRPEQFRPAPDLMAFIGLPLFVNQGDVELIVGRPGKGRDEDVSTKFDKALLAMARMVATAKGISLAEYISEAARPAIEKDFSREMKRLGGGTAD